MTTWRYIAQRLNGDGTGTFLDFDLPLRDVQLTRTLSGPARLTAKLSPEVARLIVGNQPILREWSTAIYAEADGQIRGGGILAASSFDIGEWSLDCVGFAGYPTGMPYLGSFGGVDVDPLEMVRRIWHHLQDSEGGNLGLVLDDTASPVRIGTPTGTEGGGPYVLAWWVTDDCGKAIDDLAAQTPFDYIEEHDWSGDQIVHRLRLGYPRLGRRRHDLRFVFGENIITAPTIEVDGETYANTILALGAGEGRDMVRAVVAASDGRLRRITVATDKSARKVDALTAFARRQLGIRKAIEDISTLAVRDHAQAPIGSFDVGDEIRVQGDTGWADIDLWMRITAITIAPEEGDAATLDLLRSDKVGEDL